MERHVNLLLISNGQWSHYCLIRNFSRLVRSQVIIIIIIIQYIYSSYIIIIIITLHTQLN
jgi:hypothetical protein